MNTQTDSRAMSQNAQADSCNVEGPLAPLALRASDLAGLLRVSVRQIWCMHQNGQLPEPVQLSSRVTRWDAAEIGAWWQACHTAKRIIGRAEWLRQEAECDRRGNE